MSSYLGILFMRFLAKLPLPLVRGFAAVIGRVLFVLAVPRRRVVLRNLELCFPQESAQQRKQWARESFVYFCQAWLDRSWLWHAPLPVLQKRLKLHGAVHELEGTTPTIIFGPHFYGLDAAATAIGMSTPRLFTSIYTPLPDKRLDDWIKAGRTRFGDVKMFNRFDGVKNNLSGLRAGARLATCGNGFPAASSSTSSISSSWPGSSIARPGTRSPRRPERSPPALGWTLSIAPGLPPPTAACRPGCGAAWTKTCLRNCVRQG